MECKIGRILCKAPALETASISNQFKIDDLEIIFKRKGFFKKVSFP